MRIAIMISGRGSTMQAILDHAVALRCCLIISSKSSAPGLLRARRMGISTLTLEKKIDYEALHNELKKRKIDRIFLAGFMKIIPDSFIQKWQGKMTNIHPSLLPMFPGLSGFEKSHEDKAEMGATLHEVTEELDGGPILQQVCFYSRQDWQRENVQLLKAQTYLSFTEQRLVREVSKVWK